MLGLTFPTDMLILFFIIYVPLVWTAFWFFFTHKSDHITGRIEERWNQIWYRGNDPHWHRAPQE